MAWKDTYAQITASKESSDLDVSFGYEDGRCVIYFGNKYTEWDNPEIAITEIVQGGDVTQLEDGWDMEITDVIGAVDVTESYNLPITNSDVGGNVPLHAHSELYDPDSGDLKLVTTSTGISIFGNIDISGGYYINGNPLSAEDIAYDNVLSGSAATNVQEALDEGVGNGSKYTPITTATFTLLQSDINTGINILGVQYLGGAVTITIPQNIPAGRILIVNDETENASSNNITITQ